MSKKLTNNLYKEIKKLAQGGEAKINELIQNELNQEEVVKLLSNQTVITGEMLKQLQKYQDVLTTTLKIPTKDDVANVAKLVIQLEDKLDQLADTQTTISPQSNRMQESMSQLNNRTRDSVPGGIRNENNEAVNPSSQDPAPTIRESLLSLLREQANLELNPRQETRRQEEQTKAGRRIQEAPIEAIKRRMKNIE